MIIGFELIHFALIMGASPATALVAATAGTILLAAAVTKLIERPARKWIRERYARHRHRATLISPEAVSAEISRS